MLRIPQLLNAHHQCLQWIRKVKEEKVQDKGEECPGCGKVEEEIMTGEAKGEEGGGQLGRKRSTRTG